jgi:hypothetical protein
MPELSLWFDSLTHPERSIPRIMGRFEVATEGVQPSML